MLSRERDLFLSGDCNDCSFISSSFLPSFSLKTSSIFLSGYYYNSTGLLACEPFFNKASYRILATCAFYFPTTMVLMYCYGSSFHANRFRLAAASLPSTSSSATFTMPSNHAHIMAEKVKLFFWINFHRKAMDLSYWTFHPSLFIDLITFQLHFNYSTRDCTRPINFIMQFCSN